MLRLLRRVVNFFRRREDPAQEQRPLQAEHQQGNTRLKCIHGVVTSFYGDYGLISGSIYFSCDVVTGKVPVKIGQKVAVVVEEDAASHGLKAIKVDVLCDDTDDSEPSDLGTRILTACVTSVRTDAVYISKKTCFSLDIVSEGYVPYKGDGLEVEYSLLPGTSKIKVHAVKPMNCKHVEKDSAVYARKSRKFMLTDCRVLNAYFEKLYCALKKVCITSLYGRNGVIDGIIFFTLDSLKIPDGYIPQRHDVVNVVMVESIQSCYIWRAISMTPVQT